MTQYLSELDVMLHLEAEKYDHIDNSRRGLRIYNMILMIDLLVYAVRNKSKALFAEALNKYNFTFDGFGRCFTEESVKKHAIELLKQVFIFEFQ